MTTRGPRKAAGLLNLAAGPRTAADLARQLNVSHRTLQRRLDPSDLWSPIDPARRRDTARRRPRRHRRRLRFGTGTRAAFRRVGDRIVGTRHELNREPLSQGYREGMEGYRLQHTGGGTYLGQTVIGGSSSVFDPTPSNADSMPPQAIDRSPPLATNESSFKDGPRGRFSPRSHWLTVLGVTLR